MVRALVPRVVKSRDALRPVNNLEKALAILLLGRVSGSKEGVAARSERRRENNRQGRGPFICFVYLYSFYSLFFWIDWEN